MYEWRSSRSRVFKNNIYLVFVTRYRWDVFSKEMLGRLSEIFEETCSQMDCELLEFGGEHDHIHIMVAVHPKLAVSNLVGKLKGKSSYMLRREYLDQIKTKLWGKHFWSPGYCCVSVGGASLESVRKYIENQRTPPSEKAVKISKRLSQQN
jgi:putative transposase